MTPQVLAQIHAAALTDARPWSAPEFATLMASPAVILLGDARSFLLGRLIAGEAEVLTLATAPAHQRQGHARSHLTAFCDTLRNKQATSVFLEVAADNDAAKALYLNHNFEKVGLRPQYYPRADGTKVAAIVMRRVFDAPSI